MPATRQQFEDQRRTKRKRLLQRLRNNDQRLVKLELPCDAAGVHVSTKRAFRGQPAAGGAGPQHRCHWSGQPMLLKAFIVVPTSHILLQAIMVATQRAAIISKRFPARSATLEALRGCTLPLIARRKGPQEAKGTTVILDGRCHASRHCLNPTLFGFRASYRLFPGAQPAAHLPHCGPTGSSSRLMTT